MTTSQAPEPVGHYPHAKRVGDLLFLSGVGPRKRGTKEIPGVKLCEKGCVIDYDIDCYSDYDNFIVMGLVVVFLNWFELK